MDFFLAYLTKSVYSFAIESFVSTWELVTGIAAIVSLGTSVTRTFIAMDLVASFAVSRIFIAASLSYRTDLVGNLASSPSD